MLNKLTNEVCNEEGCVIDPFCSGAAAVAVIAGAQQPRKLPLIGYLDYGAAIDRDEAFFQALRDLGWIEGRTSRSSIGGPKGS